MWTVDEWGQFGGEIKASRGHAQQRDDAVRGGRGYVARLSASLSACPWAGRLPLSINTGGLYTAEYGGGSGGRGLLLVDASWLMLLPFALCRASSFGWIGREYVETYVLQEHMVE
jgi:hypothetical protein